MNNTAIGISLVLLGTAMAGFSQILLKKAANKKYETALQEYLNPYVIIGYGIFGLTTVLGVIAVRFIPLTLYAALSASGQVFVPLLSRIILKEEISRKKALGMAMIVIGVVVFSL